jgi:hypothetical protein
VNDALQGTSYGAPCELENVLAKLVIARVPSVEMVRFVNSGTEACLSVLRLMRAYTKREKVWENGRATLEAEELHPASLTGVLHALVVFAGSCACALCVCYLQGIVGQCIGSKTTAQGSNLNKKTV